MGVNLELGLESGAGICWVVKEEKKLYKAQRHEKAQHAPGTASIRYGWGLGAMAGGWEMRRGEQAGAEEQHTLPSCQRVWTYTCPRSSY